MGLELNAVEIATTRVIRTRSSGAVEHTGFPERLPESGSRTDGPTKRLQPSNTVYTPGEHGIGEELKMADSVEPGAPVFRPRKEFWAIRLTRLGVNCGSGLSL
jgi:hypothetical protein